MNCPYPRYRDSGVEWLGDVPEHWQVVRLGHVASYHTSSVDKKTKDGELPVRLCNYTDVYYQDRIRACDGEFMEATASPQEAIRFKLNVGDVLITKDSEDWQDIAIPALIDETAADFVCGYHLGIIRSGPMADSAFMFRAMQSVSVNRQLQTSASGVTRYGLPNAAVGDVILPIPPLAEQRAIAAFLDRETQRIDALVEKKRRLIERLREYRAALITRTVARGLPPEAARAAGLDPSPRLKPSGVEWLGDVPEHWQVSRLSYLARKFGSGVTPRGGATIYQQTGVPFLRSQNIHFDGLRIQDVARIAPSLHRELASSHVNPGDVLLNITGASIGRVCSVPDDFAEGNVNQHVCIVRPNQCRLLPDLLAAYLSTPAMQYEIQFEQSGASRQGLTLQSIRNFRIVVPPLHEQTAIVEYLRGEDARLQELTSEIDSAVKRLLEYRTALITVAVTGKIDVRDAVCKPVAAATA